MNFNCKPASVLIDLAGSKHCFCFDHWLGSGWHRSLRGTGLTAGQSKANRDFVAKPQTGIREVLHVLLTRPQLTNSSCEEFKRIHRFRADLPGVGLAR